jgi:putative DNA primase/helicase
MLKAHPMYSINVKLPNGPSPETISAATREYHASNKRCIHAYKTQIDDAKTNKEPPCYVNCGQFTMSGEGLYFEQAQKKGSDDPIKSIFVSGPFEILGASRNPQGKEWGKWLRWKDADKREHTRHILDSLLQGDPAALCQSLASDGLKINRDRQRDLAKYLSEADVKGRVTLVNRTGWHEIGGKSIFVLPSETIGPQGAENVILEITDKANYASRGTLEDWKAGVGALAGDHYLPILAISTALAGPLLELSGQEGGGLNFYAASSKGKTTILQAAASVWGKGSISSGFMRAWKATGNGLEGAAAASSDTCLILDELGVADARDVAGAIYGLANGSGKTRANRNGDIREPKTWRVLSLSSGESPLATKLAEDRGRQTRAGQLVRLLDIPADRGLRYGVFDNAGSEDDAGKLADAFKAAAINSYGTAGPEFVRRIKDNNIEGEAIRLLVAEFVSKELTSGSDGQIKRAAQRLGLIMAAGELATSLGITPWKEGSVRKAAAWALQQWIDLRGGCEPAEVRQAIETMRLVIQQHGESRFEAVNHTATVDGVEAVRDAEEGRPINQRLGWRKGFGSDRIWMIPPEIWKTEICTGLDPRYVAQTLGERGMLDKPPKGWQSLRRINGIPTRVYIINTSIFERGNDAA